MLTSDYYAVRDTGTWWSYSWTSSIPTAALGQVVFSFYTKKVPKKKNTFYLYSFIFSKSETMRFFFTKNKKKLQFTQDVQEPTVVVVPGTQFCYDVLLLQSPKVWCQASLSRRLSSVLRGRTRSSRNVAPVQWSQWASLSSTCPQSSLQ